MGRPGESVAVGGEGISQDRRVSCVRATASASSLRASRRSSAPDSDRATDRRAVTRASSAGGPAPRARRASSSRSPAGGRTGPPRTRHRRPRRGRPGPTDRPGQRREPERLPAGGWRGPPAGRPRPPGRRRGRPALHTCRLPTGRGRGRLVVALTRSLRRADGHMGGFGHVVALPGVSGGAPEVVRSSARPSRTGRPRRRNTARTRVRGWSGRWRRASPRHP